MGSIRRKVRGKSSQSTISIPEATYEETSKNQDDFLKAAMKIFLVVSPPVGRVQIRSRSLTQLDALATSMVDTPDQLLSGITRQPDPPPSQPKNPSHSYHPTYGDGSPRLLLPTSSSVESSRPTRMRQNFSKSQVSSSEYFSVSFEVGTETGGLGRDEFISTKEGKYLEDSLRGVCERRCVDLSRIEVFLDSLTTPLPISTTEISYLGGRHLRITAKNEKSTTQSTNQRNSQGTSLRKTASTYRGRSGKFFSISTEETSADSDGSFAPVALSTKSSVSLKANKQRWSGFFANTKGTKMDALSELLNGYINNGVPRMTEAQMPLDLSFDDEALYSLELDWRNIVENPDQLAEKHQHQQTALWEMLQTEVAYIRTLKVVTDLFLACLISVQEAKILVEVDRTKLFGNIQDIYVANHFFWREHLLNMLNTSRLTRKPLNPNDLLRGFESFEKIFDPYARYCSEQSKCQQYCRDRLNDNELFTAYLAWCESRKECNRLRLLDILVMPMQRLTKYSLLLKAVHKNTDNREQRLELTSMIKSVDNFVASVNASLRRNEETARLRNIVSRMETYDVVESRDEELDKLIKMYNTFDIVNAPIPGCSKDVVRTLLREGDLKLRDAVTSKMEVRVLLLTDALLICKLSTKKTSSMSSASGGGLKIVRQPFVVDRIRVHELKEPSSLGLVYLNEYGTATAALVLSASEPKVAKSWMESLKKAQQQYDFIRLPPAGITNKQISMAFGDGDFDTDECEAILRTPRGSSRASRVSSLAHSHSGSMEMEGMSPGSSSFLPSHTPSRNVSMETTEPNRASSVSSEEGTEYASSYTQRHYQIKRSLLSKSPTPNTLSVQVPAFSSLGQSLPNLTLATSPQTATVSPTPPNSLLIVPQITKSKETLLSPGQRGISYPPPSPPRGALRRALALPQSRNPPLIKTRHVSASMAGASSQVTMSFDTDVNEERRRRLEHTQRMQSTSSITEEKK